MSVVTKVLATGGALGVVGGGGGYAATYLLSDNSADKSIKDKGDDKPESITDKLKKEGYTVLEDDNNEWTNILAQYQLVAKTESSLKFSDVTIESNKNLQDQCKKVLVGVASDEESYKRGAKWCTVPRTLKDILGKSRRVLSTDNSNDNTDQTEWNARIDEHNDETKNQNKKLAITPLTGNKLTHVQSDRNKMRDACRTLEGKKHYEQTFESDLEKSTLWCSVVKAG